MISQSHAPRKLIAAFLGVATLTLGLGAPGSSPATARPSDEARSSDKIPPQAQTAVEHIQENHRRFGVEAADVADLRVTDVYRSAHTGVTHVYLRQMVNSLEVARANMTVNVMPDDTILSARSRFMSDIAAKASGSVRLSPLDAVRGAARHLGLTSQTSPMLTSSSRSGDMQSRITWADVSISPIPLHLAYHSTEDGRLRLGWQLEIEEVSQEHWWQVAIDAETGNVLSKVDYVNQHTHLDDEPSPVTTADQNGRDGAKYRVFALPIESPNEGDRSVKRNPADRKASPFGWHDTDGKPGHEYTTTRGNNVHAYADYTPGANTPLPFMDADGGDELNFDFELDFDDPPHLWRDAAVTNLFYWNNIIHDVAFRYGFNEPAGNFQETNYSGERLG